MKIYYIIGLFLCVSFSSLSQTAYIWKQATSGGYAYRYVTNDPMQARFYTLKNGLTVILSPNKKVPRISVRIAVRTGSNNDPKDRTGLAHYLEHLLFKGTEKFGSLDWAREKPMLDKIDNLYEQYNSTTDTAKRKEIYKDIDKTSGEAAKFAIANEYVQMMIHIGSQITDAHTGVEETVYQDDLPSNAIDKFLTVQAERFRDPVFRLFHTELEAVYEEKNKNIDNDLVKMLETAMSSIFPTHNYGQQTTIGTIEHLKNPSIKAIRDYYDKYYVPNNMAIIMSGDFDGDQLISKIDRQFAFMKPHPVNEYAGPVEKPVEGPIEKEVFGPIEEVVQLAYRAPKSGIRQALLSQVLTAILFNGKAGLLDINLNKQQKVLGSSAFLMQFKDYGMLRLLGGPMQGQRLTDVKDLLVAQINLLKKGDFDETLIKASAANLKLNKLQEMEDNNSRAVSITDQFIKNKGTGWDGYIATPDEISKVSKKELVDFANEFFTGNNYVIVYKRKGQDKSNIKVEKPPITPVESNAGKASPFVHSIVDSPLPSLKPVWLDYTRDIRKATVGSSQILYVKNKQNALFNFSYRFEMGRRNNKLLPLAAQYLRYLGTDKYTAEEISKQFYNLACSFSIVTTDEQTTVTISGLQENFNKAVALFENLLHHCKPDTAALSAFINIQLKARANNKLNKYAIATALQAYASYGAENPYNFVLSNDELKALKATQMTDLLHSLTNYQHYIGYYGPEPLAALIAEVKKLHQLPSTSLATDHAVKFECVKQTTNQVLFCNYDAVQADIYWIKTLDSYDPKAEATVRLFDIYFGIQVFETIRESKGLAYATYGFVSVPEKRDEHHSFTAYVGCQADKLNEAIMGMNELLTDLPKTSQNYENSKIALKKDIETQRITQNDIINDYLISKRKGLDYDIRKNIYASYNNITLEDIYDYHQKEFSKKPYTYCVVASDKKINIDDLKKYGELKILSLEELFGY